MNYRYNDYNGLFYHNFCTKNDNVVFQFATSECRRDAKLTIARIDVHMYPSSTNGSTYQ